MKKRMDWRVLLGALIAAGLPCFAQAANITVDSGEKCTLADAITAANTDTAAGGCPAGAGDDTIILKTNVTLTAALPQIASTITIEGGGHSIAVNKGGNFFSVLTVAHSGNLTLNKVSINGGQGYMYSRYRQIVGGGIYNEGTVTLTNSTLSGNSAYFGGGIYNEGTVTLTNSTLSGNASRYGGGVYNYSSGTVTLIHSTISNNSSGWLGSGAGIFNGGTVHLKSSVVSGNKGYTSSTGWSSAGDEVCANSGSITADSYNLFGHDGETSSKAFYNFTPGSSDVNAASDGTIPTALAVILSPLADNGGPTKTHALPLGSPAINLTTDCTADLTTDQRGWPRPSGAGCDTGSFERGIELHIALAAVNALDPAVLNNKNNQKALANQINAVIALVAQKNYSDALTQLQSILSKMDGCAAAMTPDRNDWIRDCTSQTQVQPLIQEAIDYLDDMM